MRARLLLQVEDREAVEVASFEPEFGDDLGRGAYWFCPPEVRESLQLAAALTVEVRAYEAARREDEARAELAEDARAADREADACPECGAHEGECPDYGCQCQWRGEPSAEADALVDEAQHGDRDRFAGEGGQR